MPKQEIITGGPDALARRLAQDEKEIPFQTKIVKFAREHGWKVHHTRPARKADGSWSTPIQGDKGFPDLVLLKRATDGSTKAIAVELKSQRGATTPEQDEWLDLFRGIPSVHVAVWRPLDSDEIWALLESE